MPFVHLPDLDPFERGVLHDLELEVGQDAVHDVAHVLETGGRRNRQTKVHGLGAAKRCFFVAGGFILMFAFGYVFGVLGPAGAYVGGAPGLNALLPVRTGG